MSTIGERITGLRLARGMTQTELADAVGESKQTIYKYERGIITNIPLVKVEAIAKALHCRPDVLTGWVDSEEEKKQADQELFLTLFEQLPQSEKDFVIAQLRGLAQSRQDPDHR